MGGQEDIYTKLIGAAREAAEKTYSPYSHFPVGAALLTEDGEIFTGCNVENASYGAAICAERTAVVKAVSEGHKRFQAIAVVCVKAKDSWPCGICRQFLCEFGSEIVVVAEGSDGQIQKIKLSELLPRQFGPRALSK